MKTGSLAVFFDICKFGPHCVSPFLSCSTLPGSVTPNFPIFSTSPSSVSTRPRRECILGWAVPLALASVCRCVVGASGVVCGSSEWKLFFPNWNTGLLWGLLRVFQTWCTMKSSGVSVLQEQGLGGVWRRFLGFFLPQKKRWVSK